MSLPQMPNPPLPAAMTIAGSDSGGGAGIQADLKTFGALGVYGTSAITAITAQSTVGVFGVQSIEPEMVARQVEVILADIRVQAVKTGMLVGEATVLAVASALSRTDRLPLVIDPVTHAKSGDALIDPSGVVALREHLLPMATIVTPNLPEAEALTGIAVRTDDDMIVAGRRLLELGAAAAVVKGGHRTTDANDLYIDRDGMIWLPGERIETACTHGTGCTLSAAIAAYLARGSSLLDAVREAKAYLTSAMRAGYRVGDGHSPVNHFFALHATTEINAERITR